MTVETTIQRMFDNYPDLFATRKDCYNHLFCVIGNGYEWKRGQIVECDDEYDKPEESIIQEEYDDYASACLAPMAMQSEENIKKHDERMQLLQKASGMKTGPCNGFDEEGFPMKNSPWAVHHEECDSCRQICPLDVKMRWYPISEFSLIKRIPADIKPDWKAAVEECRLMLEQDGIKV